MENVLFFKLFSQFLLLSVLSKPMKVGHNVVCYINSGSGTDVLDFAEGHIFFFGTNHSVATSETEPYCTYPALALSFQGTVVLCMYI